MPSASVPASNAVSFGESRARSEGRKPPTRLCFTLYPHTSILYLTPKDLYSYPTGSND